MSALPQKADMCSARAHVRFGPNADSCSAAKRIVIRSARRPGRGTSAQLPAHARPKARTAQDIRLLDLAALARQSGRRIIPSCELQSGRSRRLLSTSEHQESRAVEAPDDIEKGGRQTQRSLRFLGLLSGLDPPKRGVNPVAGLCFLRGAKWVVWTATAWPIVDL